MSVPDGTKINTVLGLSVAVFFLSIKRLLVASLSRAIATRHRRYVLHMLKEGTTWEEGIQKRNKRKKDRTEQRQQDKENMI
jgi:hypothetical protein